MLGLVPVSTVGSNSEPLRCPPQSRRAPPRTASCTQSAARMASLSRMSGPRSLDSSSGSPTFSLLHCGEQQLGEFSVDGVLDENALHGNAGLPGVGEASGHAAVGGVGEIGVAVNDDARIASQFENDFFLPRIVLDGPADGGAAGEADELDALIGDEQSGIFVGEQQRVESAIRPSCLLDHFRQQQRGERRLRARA